MRSAAMSLSVAVSGSGTSSGSRHGSSKLASGWRITGTAEKLVQAARSIAHDRAAAGGLGRIVDPPDDGVGLRRQRGQLLGLLRDDRRRQRRIAPLLIDHRLLA